MKPQEGEEEEPIDLELLNLKDKDDVLQRVNKLKYEIEDCYMYLKFQDEEVKDMQEQMKNIRNNDIKLLAKQNEQYRQAFVRSSCNNKIQYHLYQQLDSYYKETHQVQTPLIKKLATYAVQVRILAKDPYEPFVNPRETMRDIQSRTIVFSVTSDFTFEQLYQKSCSFFKKDPNTHVLTDMYHNNLRILFDIPVANYFYYESGQGHCVVFISQANLNVTSLLDHQKQAVTIDNTRDLERESIIASENQKKNMLPLIHFLEEFKPGTLSYKANNQQILLKTRLPAKLYRFAINFILFIMTLEMTYNYADVQQLCKNTKGQFQFSRDSEKDFRSQEDFLKYYSFQSSLERSGYQIYDDWRELQSKYHYFLPYENNCLGIQNRKYVHHPTINIITQKSLIPIGPRRIIFKLSKEITDCPKRTQDLQNNKPVIKCFQQVYIGHEYKEDIVAGGVTYKFQENTGVDIMGGSGYVLDIPPNNDCKTTVPLVKSIIDQGILIGMNNRAIIYNENLYDHINDVFIYIQNVVTHNIDRSINVEYNIKSFKIYFGNSYVKSQSKIIFILVLIFYSFEFIIDIAAPFLNKKVDIRHIISLNNIVNVAMICCYKYFYIDRMFFLPQGYSSLEAILAAPEATFIDLYENQAYFFSSINFIGLFMISLFFKTLIQMNFIKFWSELVNIFRLSSESIFFALVMVSNMGLANSFLLKFIFGMYEEKCNTIQKAINYYLYLIFYIYLATSKDMSNLQNINFNFTFLIMSVGLFIIYNNFLCLLVAIFINNKLIMSLNRQKDESYPFTLAMLHLKSKIKDKASQLQERFRKFKARLFRKKKKKV